MLNFSEITNTVKNIIEVRIQIVKEELKEELVSVVGRIIVLVLMGLVSLFILLFLSLSLGFYLSYVTGSAGLGFLIVAGIYFLIFLVLFIVKDSERLQFSIKGIFSKFVFLFQAKKTKPNE